jgi:hypothetical protein
MTTPSVEPSATYKNGRLGQGVESLARRFWNGDLLPQGLFGHFA